MRQPVPVQLALCEANQVGTQVCCPLSFERIHDQTGRQSLICFSVAITTAAFLYGLKTNLLWVTSRLVLFCFLFFFPPWCNKVVHAKALRMLMVSNLHYKYL